MKPKKLSEIRQLMLYRFFDKKICGMVCECNHVGKLAAKNRARIFSALEFPSAGRNFSFVFSYLRFWGILRTVKWVL